MSDDDKPFFAYREAPDVQPTSIHVIARHDSLRRSLTMLLRSFGINVLSFVMTANFLRHLAKADNRPPHCVIVDLHHLDESIEALIDRLREHHHALPVLLLEGVGQDFNRTTPIVEDRSVATLIKPYQTKTLLNMLGQLTGNATIF